jgi:hypothetical protein
MELDMRIFQCLLLMFALQVQAEPILGDRIILKINTSVFSQRDMELHLMILAALDDVRSPKLFPLTNSNWLQALLLFKNDMLTYSEAEKLRQLRFEEQERSKQLATVTSNLANATYQENIKRLGIKNAEISEHLSKILIITQLKRSLEDKTKSKEDYNTWLTKTEKNYFFRFFEDAQTYKPIHLHF